MGTETTARAASVKYLGRCTLCDLKVYEAPGGAEVRAQGGGRPPETPHRHKKKPYRIVDPATLAARDEEPDHGWRGWMDYASRCGAL